MCRRKQSSMVCESVVQGRRQPSALWSHATHNHHCAVCKHAAALCHDLPDVSRVWLQRSSTSAPGCFSKCNHDVQHPFRKCSLFERPLHRALQQAYPPTLSRTIYIKRYDSFSMYSQNVWGRSKAGWSASTRFFFALSAQQAKLVYGA